MTATKQTKEPTELQYKVLDFIKAYIRAMQYPPTTREICRYFGWSSPNAAQNVLNALEFKGKITRQPNGSRTISVVEPKLRGIPLLHLDLI